MERKRMLPSWMVRVSTGNKVSKSLNADTNDVVTKEEASVVTKCTEPKSKYLTGKHKKEAVSPSDEMSFLVKCETKRKKRGFVEKDVFECDDSVQEVLQRRKHGREEKRNKFACDEDDEDLTMDDMLSIAKEFVENDRDMSQKPSELKIKSSPIHKETVSHHDSIETMTSEVTLADCKMTGDPAQDMLDLFLGPLLKKPIGKEGASSYVSREVTNQHHEVTISQKPVALAKKKSSLRDAVAMFLD